MRILPALLFVAIASVSHGTAEACSPPICWGGGFMPANSVTVPANTPALIWQPTRNFQTSEVPDPATVRLTATTAPQTPISFTASATRDGEFALVLDAPLVEGTTYVLEDTAACDGSPGPKVMFTAGPTAPYPTMLGAVQIIGHGTPQEIELATSSGSCSAPIDAMTLAIELAPSADAEPWLSMLDFETYVDGRLWSPADSINTIDAPGETWQGRNRDLIYRLCEANPEGLQDGVSAGGHTVEFRAKLHGSQIEVATASQAFELMCDPSPGGESEGDDEIDGGGGCSSTQSSSGLAALGLVGLVGRRGRRAAPS